MSGGGLVVLGAAWLAYGALHSLLADRRVKAAVTKRWPAAGRWYRLVYNVLALLLLVPPVVLTHAQRGVVLWDRPGAWGWAADGLALLALAVFVWSLRAYDLATFIGLRQWRDGCRDPDGPQAFHISPLHRYVRHPWYSSALVVIWTRDWDPAWLVTAAALTFYLWLGARWEEAKLVESFGEAYRAYQRQVPFLMPRPWRRLTPQAAQRLTRVR